MAVSKPTRRVPVSAKKPAARKVVSAKRPVAVKAAPRRPVPAKKIAVVARPRVAVKAAATKAAVAKVAKPVKTARIAKPVKVKVVRAGFSFPKHEYAALVDLKKRAKKLGAEFKKSEILRAGLAHLLDMTDATLRASLAKIERIKTGRPTKKSKKK